MLLTSKPLFLRPQWLSQLSTSLRQRVSWPERDYLLNEERKYVYCPIQKNACSSLMRAFLQTHGWADDQIGDPHNHIRQFQLAQQSRKVAHRILNDPEYFVFAFVRNPWDRVVSAYLNLLFTRNEVSEPVLQFVHSRRRPKHARLIRPGDWTDLTFSEFLEFLAAGNPRTYNVHWKPQYFFLQGHRIDFIGRFERMPDDFEIIRERLGIDRPLRKVNATCYGAPNETAVSGVADWTPEQLRELPALPKHPQFYNRKTAKLIWQIYKTDIELFGYQSAAWESLEH